MTSMQLSPANEGLREFHESFALRLKFIAKAEEMIVRKCFAPPNGIDALVVFVTGQTVNAVSLSKECIVRNLLCSESFHFGPPGGWVVYGKSYNIFGLSSAIGRYPQPAAHGEGRQLQKNTIRRVS